MLNCVSQFDIYSVIVESDRVTTNALIDILQQPSSSAINDNVVFQQLASGNRNRIGQLLTSISQGLTQMNTQIVKAAVASKRASLERLHSVLLFGLDGITATSLFVTPLGSTVDETVIFLGFYYRLPHNFFVQPSRTPNASILADYQQQLNRLANALDNLIPYTIHLAANTIDDIKIQASALAKLTETTNQLTRSTTVIPKLPYDPFS